MLTPEIVLEWLNKILEKLQEYEIEAIDKEDEFILYDEKVLAGYQKGVEDSYSFVQETIDEFENTFIKQNDEY